MRNLAALALAAGLAAACLFGEAVAAPSQGSIVAEKLAEVPKMNPEMKRIFAADQGDRQNEKPTGRTRSKRIRRGAFKPRR
jgi:hypothetical protein